jgi:hypothetical protein
MMERLDLFLYVTVIKNFFVSQNSNFKSTTYFKENQKIGNDIRQHLLRKQKNNFCTIKLLEKGNWSVAGRTIICFYKWKHQFYCCNN